MRLVEVYVFGIIFILILLPILYFIPIGISLKEKVLIAIVSFVLAEIGLFLNQFLGIWKTLLILVLLAVVVTYIVETRIRPRLTDNKGQRKAILKESEESPDLFIKKEETVVLDSDLDSESDGDYDLGQDAIDRLLSEMNKSKTEHVEETPDAGLDTIHNNEMNIENEDYIEPVASAFINKENTEDEIDVIEPANTMNQTETDIDVIEKENMLNEEESIPNQDLEVVDIPEEDPSQLAKSIDADLEIDFEKQLEEHTSDGNYYEENNQCDDELLLERSQLFEHLDELEDGNDKEDPDNIEMITDENEGQSIQSIEELVDQLDDINPIEQLETDEPVGSIEGILGEINEIEKIEQVDESQPKIEDPIENVFEELNEIEPMDQLEYNPEESIESLLEELDDIEPIEEADENKLDESIESVFDGLDEIESIDQLEDNPDGTIESVLIPYKNDEIDLLEDKPEESNESVIAELEEIDPFEQMDVEQPVNSIENILEELEEIGPSEYLESVQLEESIESVLEEEPDDIEQIDQVNEEEPVETFESILAELEEVTPFEQEKAFQSDDNLIDDKISEENEPRVIEENHKIMDDIEDITTSEETHKDDTIVEEYVQEQKVDENTIDEEMSPTRSEIQRQMLQTMVSQINYSKSSLTDEEYEDLVHAYLQPSLPALEYYTFAYMLIEHYIAKGQFNKLTELINELYNKFDKYPVIKLQLDYLIEKYKNG